jgi:hypothetical protein
LSEGEARAFERVNWTLYSPFKAIRAAAEFSYGETVRGTSRARRPTSRKDNYISKKYNIDMELEALYLESSDFLIFTHTNRPKDGGRGGVVTEGRVLLSYPHLVRFQDALAKVMDRLAGNCFVRDGKENTFRLTKDAKLQEMILVEDCCSSAAIGFAPSIIPEDKEDPSERPAGICAVRMFLNSPDMYSDAVLDDFAAFERFYQNFDLFALSRSAMQMAYHEGAVGTSATKWGVSAPQPTRRSRA